MAEGNLAPSSTSMQSAGLSPKRARAKNRSVQFAMDPSMQESLHQEQRNSHSACNSREDLRSNSSAVHGIGYRSDGEDLDGSPISVLRPSDSPPDLEIYEVGLGMLRQHTIYAIKFCLPAGQLQTGDVEIVRSSVVVTADTPQFERTAELDVMNITYLKSEAAYQMDLKFTTTRCSHVSESYALRSTADPDNCIYFILRCNALGRGAGTPSLRLGIHRLGHTTDYEDSDEKTEWQGFD
uniref:Adipose-secreted signaling protein n=1 Tax=Schistocephalus solidus TaxID=70667 RepID=A0A0X3NX38_SCHSO